MPPSMTHISPCKCAGDMAYLAQASANAKKRDGIGASWAQDYYLPARADGCGLTNQVHHQFCYVVDIPVEACSMSAALAWSRRCVPCSSCLACWFASSGRSFSNHPAMTSGEGGMVCPVSGRVAPRVSTCCSSRLRLRALA